ncbi:hypothetical protein O9X98_14695 [Agrobacterium salinitolerans]|nr:hypothetical protein [Agrobacterium salinitolerans]
MEPIGRKSYHYWGPKLVLGFGLVTKKWTRFKVALSGTSIVEIHDLWEMLGEVNSRFVGGPLASPYGRAVDEHVTDSRFWRTVNDDVTTRPVGFCGRRMVTTWSDDVMLIIDKVVCDPKAKYGVEDTVGGSSMLCELVEFDGVLIERRLGRPTGNVFGKTANQIVEGSIASGSPWLTERDNLLLL